MTLYSYLPALLDQTIRMACELVRTVNASVTTDLYQQATGMIVKKSNKHFTVLLYVNCCHTCASTLLSPYGCQFWFLPQHSNRYLGLEEARNECYIKTIQLFSLEERERERYHYLTAKMIFQRPQRPHL